MKTTSRTEKKRHAFESAPRCGARTKGNHGKPCRCPAIRGKARCRVHGGAKGSGAKIGNSNAVKHGYTTATAKTYRREVHQVLKASRELAQNLANRNRSWTIN